MLKQHFYLLSLDNNHESKFSTDYWGLLFQMIFCKRGLLYEENVEFFCNLFFFLPTGVKPLKHLPWISAGETSHPQLAKGGEDSIFSAACVRHLASREGEDRNYWHQLPAGISKMNSLIFCLAFHWKVNVLFMGKPESFVLAMYMGAVPLGALSDSGTCNGHTHPNSVLHLQFCSFLDSCVHLIKLIRHPPTWLGLIFPPQITAINYFWEYWHAVGSRGHLLEFGSLFWERQGKNQLIMRLQKSTPYLIQFSVSLCSCPGGAGTSAFLSVFFSHTCISLS